MYGLIAGGVLGAAGLIGKAIQRGKSNREMDRLMKQNPAYQKNPIAQQRLALAQSLLNARTPGYVSAERNIYTNQANQLGGVQRNATDAAQALAVMSGIGANTNQAFQNLADQESQDYQWKLSNLNNAQELAIGEDDKLYNDDVRRYQDTVQMKGAQMQNKAATWGDLSNFGFSLMDFSANSGGDNSNANNSMGRRSSSSYSGITTNSLMNQRFGKSPFRYPTQKPKF